MACSTNLIADIINDCAARPTKGIYPTAWIIPFAGREYTKTDNLITLLTSPQGVFTKIESNKFGLNVGSDVVTSDVKTNGYLHKFTGILSQVGNKTLDELDGIIVVVKKGTTYMVYGLQNGLWKTAQSRTANDNSGMLTVEFSTRADMEEDYSEYYFDTATSGGLFATITPENYIENYEHISTLSIGTNGIYQLTVDSGKGGYVVLPDGAVKACAANGRLLNTQVGQVYTGVAGKILFIYQKGTTLLSLNAQGNATVTYSGECITNFSGATLECFGDLYITGVSANNVTGTVNFANCDIMTYIHAESATERVDCGTSSVTDIIAPLAGEVVFDNSSVSSLSCPAAFHINGAVNSLTAVAIASILSDAVASGYDEAEGFIDITGGTNAIYSTWSVQAKADKDTLVSRNWDVQNNA